MHTNAISHPQDRLDRFANPRTHRFPKTLLSFAISLGVCSTQAQDALSPTGKLSLEPAPIAPVLPELLRPASSEDWGMQRSMPTQDALIPFTNWRFGPNATLALNAVDQPLLAQPTSPLADETFNARLRLEAAPDNIWENGVGEGFRSKTQSITMSAGATYGLDSFGSRDRHHLAMASLTYGYMLGVVGEGHWYHGNPELQLELFGGAQFDPDARRFIGLTPHLRYNFATGTRWVPFVDAGAGLTATTIGPPDLSGTFEFNLQAGTGLQYFLRDHLAIGLEARYVHWSCAGMHKPNQGLNGITSLLGLTYFF
jgi:opacity protein-like surface antigen